MFSGIILILFLIYVDVELIFMGKIFVKFYYVNRKTHNFYLEKLSGGLEGESHEQGQSKLSKMFLFVFPISSPSFYGDTGGDSTIQMFIYPLGQGQYYYMQCSKRA